MMGRRENGQGQFFYSFDLDEVVPSDHLVRQIDSLLDLGWVHEELAPYYSHTGRPSIDPVLMIRMLLVGYVFAIRSERRICAEIQLNLAYRWFCKLGIEDKIPDVGFEAGPPFFAYDANYLIDNKVGIIIDAVGTRANRTVEIAVTQTMVDRVEHRFNLRPQRLVGDTVYGAVRLLKWLVDRNIAPHVPVWDKSARTDGTFSRADFIFDRERNVYICPGGAQLTSTGNIDQGHIVYYRASKGDCSRCSLKPKCTTAVVRKITRDLNEDVRDRVRALANTEAFQQSRRERKKVEMRFAHMKRIFRLDRLRLRGLKGVQDEVLLTAIAQNSRRLANLLCCASLHLSATG